MICTWGQYSLCLMDVSLDKAKWEYEGKQLLLSLSGTGLQTEFIRFPAGRDTYTLRQVLKRERLSLKMLVGSI